MTTTTRTRPRRRSSTPTNAERARRARFEPVGSDWEMLHRYDPRGCWAIIRWPNWGWSVERWQGRTPRLLGRKVDLGLANPHRTLAAALAAVEAAEARAAR